MTLVIAKKKVAVIKSTSKLYKGEIALRVCFFILIITLFFSIVKKNLKNICQSSDICKLYTKNNVCFVQKAKQNKIFKKIFKKTLKSIAHIQIMLYNINKSFLSFCRETYENSGGQYEIRLF